MQYPVYTEQLCGMIAAHFQPQDIQLIAGPTTGGVILAFEVARQLGVRGIFAEREGDIRSFRRGFNISPGERTLIVDDIATTGKSVDEVTAAVTRQGGTVAGIGVLVDRSEKGLEFGVPFFSCLRTVTPTYRPEDCPLCKAKISLTRPGGS